MAEHAAMAWPRTAAELVPDAPGFRLGLAWALINAGRPGEAWPILSALRDSADTPDLAERIRRAMGVCARKLGQAADAGKAQDEAVTWHRTAAELVPDAPGFRLGLAWALFRARRMQEAWQMLAQLADE